jgi:hypothetical protein
LRPAAWLRGHLVTALYQLSCVLALRASTAGKSKTYAAACRLLMVKQTLSMVFLSLG